MGRVELPGVGSFRSPREQESSVPVELHDACIRAVTVGDEDVALAVKGDVARTGELIAGAAGASRRSSAALTGAGRRGLPGGRRNSHRHSLGFAAEDHQHVTVGSELDDLARALVDDPDVVPGVDPHAVRDEKSIDALADFLDIVAARIEL